MIIPPLIPYKLFSLTNNIVMPRFNVELKHGNRSVKSVNMMCDHLARELQDAESGCILQFYTDPSPPHFPVWLRDDNIASIL